MGKQAKVKKKSEPNQQKIGLLDSIVFTWTIWENGFAEIKEYKAMHGDCLVPIENHKELFKWVSTQRLQYKYFQEGKKSALNQHKIDLLDGIGFTWTIHVTWDDRFEEMKEYKATHGDRLVPTTNHKELFKWVSTQRLQYKYFQEGKKSALNQHKIDLLDGIGFTWTIHVTWEDRFEEIKEYKATHGDYRVPRDSHKQLSAWVNKQKSDYKYFQEGKKSAQKSRQD